MARNHYHHKRELDRVAEVGRAYVDDWSSGDKVTEYLEGKDGDT